MACSPGAGSAGPGLSDKILGIVRVSGDDIGHRTEDILRSRVQPVALAEGIADFGVDG